MVFGGEAGEAKGEVGMPPGAEDGVADCLGAGEE